MEALVLKGVAFVIENILLAGGAIFVGYRFRNQIAKLFDAGEYVVKGVYSVVRHPDDKIAATK